MTAYRGHWRVFFFLMRWISRAEKKIRFQTHFLFFLLAKFQIEKWAGAALRNRWRPRYARGTIQLYKYTKHVTFKTSRSMRWDWYALDKLPEDAVTTSYNLQLRETLGHSIAWLWRRRFKSPSGKLPALNDILRSTVAAVDDTKYCGNTRHRRNTRAFTAATPAPSAATDARLQRMWIHSCLWHVSWRLPHKDK